MRRIFCGKILHSLTMLLPRMIKNAMAGAAMRISCPNCQTLYDVPGTLLGSRPRRLRCSECGHSWLITPELLEAAPEDELATAAGQAAPPAEAGSNLSPDRLATAASLPAGSAAEHDPLGDFVPPPLDRRFGEAVDDEAKAGMQAALQSEAAAAAPRHDEADQNSAEPGAELNSAQDRDSRELDAERFAGLVQAARTNNAHLDVDPHGPPARKSSSKLLLILVVLLLLALIVIERGAIMRLIPGSAALFRALHLA